MSLIEFAYHYCFDCIYWSMFWLVFLSVSPPSPGRIVDNIFGHYWLKCWNCRTAMVWLVDFSLTVVLIGGFFTHCCLDWWVFHSLLSWLVDFSLTVVLIGGFFTHCCLDWCSSRSFHECWDDSPINRPDFESVKKTIHRINPHKMSPVDLMMAMVSKTSTSIMNNGGNNWKELLVQKHRLKHNICC
jgi:hypothetical protein